MKTLAQLATFTLCGLASASAQDVLSELFNPLAPFPPVPNQLRDERTPEQRDPNGPWKNDVLIYRTKADGTAEQIGAFPRAGVPTLTRLQDGRLMAAFQNFPSDDQRNFDRVAVCFSSDEGRTWTKPDPVAVTGMEEGLARPFDPTLVALPDGRIRMYFTSNRHHDFSISTPQIYSAISQDGIHYTFEPGVRFGLEGRVVIDCAAVLHQGLFHLYSPDNGSTTDFHQIQLRRQEPPIGSAYHATSTDGLTFTRVADVRLDDMRWLGNAQSDGKAITFFGSGRGIVTAASTDGATWRQTGGFRLAGADPGAAAAKDGGWIIIATGPPRDGSRNGMQQNRPQMHNQWLAEWTTEQQMFDTLLRKRDAGR